MADTMTTPCECEHVSHFAEDPAGAAEADPAGAAHDYGHECDVESMTEVRTDWGTFRVCVDCARTHLKEWAK